MGRQRKTNDLDMALHDGKITKRDDIDPNRRWVWLLDEVRALKSLLRFKDGELVKQAIDWQKVVDRQEATLQLRQNLINQREGERDEYKNMCDEYEGEIDDLGSKIALLEADLLTMAEVKDEELQKVVDREHAIHNEAAAGMIAKVKELEDANSSLYQNYKQLKGQCKNVQNIIGIREERIAELEAEHGRRSTLIAHQDQRIAELDDSLASGSEAFNRLQQTNAELRKSLDLAASNEQVRMKQLAERELVIIQKAERIKELEQKYSKLQQDLEYDKQLLAQHEEAAGDRPTSLERDIQRALNYWGADADLGTADFILAHFLNRQLLSLKAMKRAEREHGIPPTRVVSDARLASISIDDDGLGTIDLVE